VGGKVGKLKTDNPDPDLVTWNIQNPYNSDLQIQVQSEFRVTGTL